MHFSKGICAVFCAFIMTFMSPVLAGELAVSVEIPRMEVAEYHRPYTAIWIEEEGKGVVANLAVWYSVDLEDEEGEDWLKDIRQWWRRTGRSLELPIDGISGATRAPGIHKVIFSEDAAPLGKLLPGNYRLIVEAAREVGGREMLEVPFVWPTSQKRTLTAQGESELGKLILEVGP